MSRNPNTTQIISTELIKCWLNKKINIRSLKVGLISLRNRLKTSSGRLKVIKRSTRFLIGRRKRANRCFLTMGETSVEMTNLKAHQLAFQNAVKLLQLLDLTSNSPNISISLQVILEIVRFNNSRQGRDLKSATLSSTHRNCVKKALMKNSKRVGILFRILIFTKDLAADPFSPPDPPNK